jgi:hypothetical protein
MLQCLLTAAQVTGTGRRFFAELEYLDEPASKTKYSNKPSTVYRKYQGERKIGHGPQMVA